jgi:hypothetical protein
MKPREFPVCGEGAAGGTDCPELRAEAGESEPDRWVEPALLAKEVACPRISKALGNLLSGFRLTHGERLGRGARLEATQLTHERAFVRPVGDDDGSAQIGHLSGQRSGCGPECHPAARWLEEAVTLPNEAIQIRERPHSARPIGIFSSNDGEPESQLCQAHRCGAAIHAE